MKKTITLFSLAVALLSVTLITSCDKQIDLFVDLDEQTYCLPDTNISLSNGFKYSFDVQTDGIKKAFEAQSLTYETNRVDDITFESANLEFVSGEKGNLSELDLIDLRVKKKGESGDGTQVALGKATDEGATTIKLNPTGSSIKFLLSESVVTFTVITWQKNNTGNKAVCVKLKDGRLTIKGKK